MSRWAAQKTERMNYRYVPDAHGVLKSLVESRSSVSLHELRTSHPTLRSMSLDHLSVLLEQISSACGLVGAK